MGNPAAGGGRRVDVAPQRFPGWVAAFECRPGATRVDADLVAFVLAASGGAAAACHVPLPPLATDLPPENTPAAYARAAAEHAAAARTVGVLLAG